MTSKKRTNINFFNQFVVKSKIPWPYLNIGYITDKDVLFLENTEYVHEPEYGLSSYRLIPEYLKPTINPKLHLKIFRQFNKGYAIDLQKYVDVNTFVKHQFKGDSKNILKRVKRLTTCFNITYKVFREETSEKEYTFLMDHFYHMLMKRFEERNDKNENLDNWDDLHTNVFALIKVGKASLSVIYHNEKPIQITLAYHVQKILFSAIPAYDIDYSKFGLGNTAIYNQIDWCLQNDYKILDMGYGDLEYKRRWSNVIYNFEHHIVNSSHDFKIKIRAYVIYQIFKLKELLKEKGVKKELDKWKLYFKRKQAKIAITEQPFFQIEDFSEVNLGKENTMVDIDTKAYAFLRRPVYDFLYTSMEHISKIKVYELERNKSYVLQDGKQTQKLVCKI